MKILCNYEVTCIREPRGNNNLEGYDIGTKYDCQMCEDSKGIYYRIYQINSNYYECCNKGIFQKYFKIDNEYYEFLVRIDSLLSCLLHRHSIMMENIDEYNEVSELAIMARKITDNLGNN